MAKKTEGKRNAPYVSASTMSQFLDHIRYVSTPKKVDAGLLADYNISQGNIFPLISALKFLRLIDNTAKPTPAFGSLQTMGEEFRSNLDQVIRGAYADLFSKLDIARDSREHLRNYFARNYSTSQADKATILFLDLCAEADIPTAEGKPKRGVEIKPAVHTPEVTKEGKPSEAEASETIPREYEEQGQHHFNIRIDSKDVASMQPEQIRAFFDGLSKVTKREEKIKE